MPAPGHGAVVARVDLACVCSTDVHLHHGYLAIPTSIVLGHALFGRIWRFGQGVRTDVSDNLLQGGDKIAWISNLPCAKHCWCVVAGERTLCETRMVYGDNQGFDDFPRLSGAWSEVNYVQPGSAIFRLPDNLSAERVNALGCAGPTAVHGVIAVVGIAAGDTVVVLGSGPVGITSSTCADLAGRRA